LIHEYFGVEVISLWDVVRNKLPALDGAVEGLLEERGHH
jgi:uncharacterized protein with HEPN domain